MEIKKNTALDQDVSKPKLGAEDLKSENSNEEEKDEFEDQEKEREQNEAPEEYDQNEGDEILNFEEELRAAFKEFDEDESGEISKQEFGNFMRKLGYHPTMVELQEMIDEVDRDRHGSIGFEDFKTIMTRTIRDEFTQNSSIEAFAVFDKSKSDKISKDVLLNILNTKGDQNLSPEEINEIMSYAFQGDEDHLNYRDFVKNTFDLFK
jgi:Ca2+-binding EF-hand superfamily protein